MPGVAITGLQWGDEGKGKIIDSLALEADIVCRYQGGQNAGHTIWVGDEKTVLHIVPSGVLYPGKVCVIGNGTVIDLEGLSAELKGLEERFAVGGNARGDGVHVVALTAEAIAGRHQGHAAAASPQAFSKGRADTVVGAVGVDQPVVQIGIADVRCAQAGNPVASP